MLAAVVDRLRCPHCGDGLALADATLRCARGHAHDVARQGYVTLLPRGVRPARGDTAAMVQARTEFLAAGHYAPFADAVAAAAPAADCVVDVGAGTGYYLARVLDRLPEAVGIALDSSRPALRRAARAHPRIGAVACDVWRALPVRDGAAQLALNAFAPRNGAELARVVAPGGALVVVTPTPGHLAELVAGLGLLRVDADKPERLARTLGSAFELERRRTVELPLLLDAAAVRSLALMGPSAYHLGGSELERRLEALRQPVSTTASVSIETYRCVTPGEQR